ncbi:MAG: outer membrane protein assembly factor BamB, partial [Halovenus sp.]
GPDGREKAGGEFNLGAQIKGTVAAYEGLGYVGSWDRRLHCIDLSDGSEVWTFDTGRSNMSNPAVDPDAGVVYTGSDSGYVWALDPETGEELWTADVDGRVIGALSVTAETVLAGSYDSHLYALDRTTGERRWRVENRGKVTSGAVPVDGRIYYAERATFSSGPDGEPVLEKPGHTYCLSAA